MSLHYCQCGAVKRINAILCRGCWLRLPPELRQRLPFRAGDPSYERIARACRDYANLNLAIDTSESFQNGVRNKHRLTQLRSETQRHETRQREILARLQQPIAA